MKLTPVKIGVGVGAANLAWGTYCLYAVNQANMLPAGGAAIVIPGLVIQSVVRGGLVALVAHFLMRK